MEILEWSRARAALAGVALAGVVVLAAVFAAVGGTAVPPTSGVGCQADGKISGRGGTLDDRAQEAWAAGFTADVCGDVPDDPANPGRPSAPAGNAMVEYNEYSPSQDPANGSGYGLKAMACRTDAFGASDIPYYTSDLQALDTSVASTAIVGSGDSCQTALWDDFGTSFFPPFPPQDVVSPGGSSSYPSSSDQVAPMMSFPVTGTAVAVIANLTAGPVGSNATCQNASNASPPTLDLTGLQLSALFGGVYQYWDDPRLTSNNPSLSTDDCIGPITRVVNADDSGTTQIFETYLSHVDQHTLCDGSTWQSLVDASPNTNWPGFTSSGDNGGGWSVPATAFCSAVQQGYINGDDGVLDACIGNTGGGSPFTGIPGAVCYADLPNFRHFGDGAPNGGGPRGKPGCAPCSAAVAFIQNGTLTAYQAPAKVTSANCNFGSITIPGGSWGGVGLTTGTAFTPPNTVPLDWDTWAIDNPWGDHADVTNIGFQYPICGVSFAMVYTGLQDATQPNALAGLNADQRRTLYGYFSYVLSSAGQQQVESDFYQALPPSLLYILRPEFQDNF